MAEHIEYQGNFSGSQIDALLTKIQSSQVFTTEEKTKLASLVNYDDTEVKEDISDIETSLNSHKSDKTNPHEVTKAQVGLGNVDNTSDVNKPISTATQAALDNKVNKVDGKGLSANDFTNADKAQISANKEGIGAVANDSSKNRLKVTRSGATISGVTFTVNSDGTVTVNGTATDLIRFDVSTEMRVEIGKTYILSGCPKLSGILVQYSDKTSYAKNDTGEGVDFNAVSTGTPTIIIRVNPNVVLNNVTFKPMICTPEEWDMSQEFVPYAPTNRELYETIDSIESELSVPIISSSTLLTDYANTLSRGYHTAFFASASKPSDAPISDNCFVEIFVYSGSTAIMRVIPTGTAHYANNYVKTKVSGTWQSGWVVFTGTAQSGS